MAIAFALVACTNGSLTAPLDRQFRLGVGETVSIVGTNLTVSFVGVPQDSRCPAGALCVQSIQAGNARVALTVTQQGAPTPVTLNTTVGAQYATIGGYTIALSALTPYPSVGAPQISDKDYRATLAIEATR